MFFKKNTNIASALASECFRKGTATPPLYDGPMIKNDGVCFALSAEVTP